jgi:hypothetical protein
MGLQLRSLVIWRPNFVLAYSSRQPFTVVLSLKANEELQLRSELSSYCMIHTGFRQTGDVVFRCFTRVADAHRRIQLVGLARGDFNFIGGVPCPINVCEKLQPGMERACS